MVEIIARKVKSKEESPNSDTCSESSPVEEVENCHIAQLECSIDMDGNSLDLEKLMLLSMIVLVYLFKKRR